MPKMKKLQRTCSVCGKEFYSYPSQSRNFCSYECRDKAKSKQVSKECVNCGSIFSVKMSEERVKCCSVKCGYEYRKKLNPNSNKYNRAVWREARLVALKRDGFKCVSCGSRSSLDVHHIVSVKNGGKDEPDNLVTFCKECHITMHKINEISA
jgi:ribosomal protein S27AE